MSEQAQPQSHVLSHQSPGRSTSYDSTGFRNHGGDLTQPPTSMLMPMSVDLVGDDSDNNKPDVFGATKVKEVHVRQVQFDGDTAASANTSLWHAMLRSPPPPPRSLWSDDDDDDDEDNNNGDSGHDNDNVSGPNTSATRHYQTVPDTSIGICFETAAFNRQHDFARPLAAQVSSSDQQHKQAHEQDSPASSSRTMDDYQDEDDDVYWNATQGMMQRKPTPHPNDMRRTLARRLEAIKLQTRQPHRIVSTAVQDHRDSPQDRE